ncbi:hypothetical protein [Hydrogenophaga sp.]|uniref:hypothetical protein n=1 Tax=Hydrogenophaga sp. TaxID=1904254 RepID=UPI00271B772B|nr:hypothetical protein [Hydrogenophaga sp.]MDO9435644.1 hypothetical protein [Hydrogenophaga sp.]
MFDLSRARLRSFVLSLLACVLLSACGGNSGNSGDGGSSTPEAPGSVSVVIGPAGGTVTGPDGVQVLIPAGALRTNTTIGIARTRAGAPAPDAMLATQGTVYEFTPHGIAFEVPVTVRYPLAGLASPEVWMASADTAWSQIEAIIGGGFASVERNSFSWGYVVTACSIPANSPPNPDGCFSPRGGTTLAANPANALTRISTSNAYINPVGTFRVDAAATLTFSTHYNLWPSCSNARVTFYRRQLDKSPLVLETLYDAQNVGLTQGFFNGQRGAGGTTVLPNVNLSHLDRGRHVYAVYVACQRGDGFQARYTDTIVVNVEVPTPTTTQTIGGNVSGLTGPVVMRNNGADDLTVNADGAFTFATPVGTGSPYNVTVGTPPAGQICSVQNGSGMANTDVNNVALTCSAGSAPTWRGEGLIDNSAFAAYNPKVATDAQGNAFAVWMQYDGTRHNIWASRYATGGSWGTPQAIESGNGNAEYPEIAIDPAGNATAIWTQHDGSAPSIRSATYTGGAWGLDEAVESGNGAASAPHLGVDANGNVLAVWVQQDGGTRIKRNRRVGGVWQGEANLDGGVGPAGAPRVAVFPGGNAIAVWQQEQGGTYHLFHNVFNGIGWSSADRLFDNTTSYIGEPRIAASDGGTAIVVWAQGNGGTASSDVLSLRYAGGLWGFPELHSAANAQSAFDPRIATNANGQTMVVWRESHGDTIQTWAKRRMPDGAWDASAVRLDAPLVDASTSRGVVDVAIDVIGNAMAVWSHNLPGQPHSDLFAARYDANALQWAAPQRIENNNADGINSCAVAMDANGHAIAVWDQAASIWANVFR